MPLSVAFAVIIFGPWLFGRATKAIHLPAILGMLLFGIVYGALSGGRLDVVPPLPGEIDAITGFIKTAALIVILFRAGLGTQKSSLQQVGASAIRMALIPCLMETVTATFAFRWLFGFDTPTALVGASILAAVSLAVVVPQMLDLKAHHHDRVPTLVLASASVDNAVAITIFTAAAGLASGGDVSIERAALLFPVSIASGLLVGTGLGFATAWFFHHRFAHIRATEKSLLLVVLGLILVDLGNTLPFAALLAIMTIGFVILERAEHVAHEAANKLSKLWVPAEILLFVLIGLQVDLPSAAAAGLRGLAVIGLGLVGRSIGVLLAVTPDRSLSWRERLFALVAFLPKATVQAALGAVPLSMGIAGGQEILSVAVLSILVTSPIGLMLIRGLAPRLLAPARSESTESSSGEING